MQLHVLPEHGDEQIQQEDVCEEKFDGEENRDQPALLGTPFNGRVTHPHRLVGCAGRISLTWNDERSQRVNTFEAWLYKAFDIKTDSKRELYRFAPKNHRPCGFIIRHLYYISLNNYCKPTDFPLTFW